MSVRRFVTLQISIGGFVAAGFFLKNGALAAQSAIYGTGVSVILASLLMWGVIRAATAAKENKNKSAVLLYIGAAQRFLLALVLFALGMSVLKLDAMAIIVGFGLSQVTYFIQARKQQTPDKALNLSKSIDRR